jgi:acetyl-CoA carboxylase carboxyltransferase component
MLFAFVEATVPKITIIFRKAYAGAYVGMCCKDTGADLVYAWPTAVIALVAPETAVSVLYAKEIASSPDPEKTLNQRLTEYDLNYSNPYLAAQRGYIDAIIEPKDTRKQIIHALKLTKGKKEVRPKKKYANITL